MDTELMILSIMSGSDIREAAPWARMSAGTRSRAITATAPASSAILACSAVTTSMMTPPLSISAMPRLTRAVPTLCCSDIQPVYGAAPADCAGRGAARSAAGRDALADENDPGVARGERQRLAGRGAQRGARAGRRPAPGAVDALALPE